LGHTSTIFTGIFFLYAGIAKAANPAAFVSALAGYQFNWPGPFVHLIAVIIPGLEVGLGVAIMGNLVASHISYRRLTLGAGATLLLTFLGVILWGLSHRDVLACGCFGNQGALGPVDIVRDVLFLGVAAAGMVAYRRG
jgi:hypothetical protein